MNKKEIAQIFGMELKEAYDFLASKGLQPTFSYTELKKEAHIRAFTVAKMLRLDLLNHVKHSLEQAIKEGKGFQAWKEEIIPILKSKGWWGEVEVINPKTGQIKIIRPAARLRTIYETNLRSAYAVGRYIHQQKAKKAVYWMYVSALLETTRPKHRAMHGTVLPRDHPFWERNYPPNGYNCRCKVRAYTKKQLERRGIKPAQGDVEDIADKGWEYNPGRSGAERLQQVWRKKIQKAPQDLGAKSLNYLQLLQRYQQAFQSDTPLKTIMEAFMPQMLFDQNLSSPARYYPKTETIFFKSMPKTSTLRHESGHHLDNITGFPSKELTQPLKRDLSLWQLKKEEIVKLLRDYKEEIAIQDLFYLTSKGKIGYVQTRETKYLTEDKIHKEAFANFFEIYLAQDERLEILQKYFKYSYAKFLKILEAIKELYDTTSNSADRDRI